MNPKTGLIYIENPPDVADIYIYIYWITGRAVRSAIGPKFSDFSVVVSGGAILHVTFEISPVIVTADHPGPARDGRRAR